MDNLDTSDIIFVTAMILFFAFQFGVNLWYNNMKNQYKKLREPRTLEGRFVRLFHKAKTTQSPAVLIVFNKETNKMLYGVQGNEFELMQKIAETTDTHPEADEFMQIIGMYYNEHSKTKNL